MKNKKNNHSPIDIAVFSGLNSFVFGTLYTLSLFHPSLDESKLNIKGKIGLIIRNGSTITVIYGMNQFLRQYFSIEENRKIIKKNFYMNDKKLNICSSFISSIIPFYLGYKIYFFRNKNEFISKSVFIICGLSMLFVELLDLNKNKKY